MEKRLFALSPRDKVKMDMAIRFCEALLSRNDGYSLQAAVEDAVMAAERLLVKLGFPE